MQLNEYAACFNLNSFYETQYVAAGVNSVAHRHKSVCVWETLLLHFVCCFGGNCTVHSLKFEFIAQDPRVCNVVQHLDSRLINI